MIKICTPQLPVYIVTDNNVKREAGVTKETLDFVDSLPKDTFVWRRCLGHYLEEQRNALINDNINDMAYQKLDPRYTHYLLLDSDNAGTLDDIEKLLSHDLPIVSAAYTRRGDKSKYVAGKWSKAPGLINEYISSSTKGMYKADWVGMGFLLIKAEVFQQMIYPWWEIETIEYGNLRRQTRDDACFCLKCQRLNYPIYLDCDVVVKHMS